jgi:type I restriction enzyme S subunit
MKKEWPRVRLGEILQHRKEFITIDDLTTYRRPRVQLHAQGIILRDEVPGALIKTKTQQVCRAGELLVAEIDAKVGGFGILPEPLDGSIVSSHYFLFYLDELRLDRRFLKYFISTPEFREQVAAQGSTNYAAIRPADVLGYEIPLPPLTEQRRVVARIEELAAQIHEARSLRQLAAEQAKVLILSKVTSLFDGLVGSARVPIRTLGVGGKNPVQTGPFGAQLHSSEFVEEGVPVLNVGNVWPEGLRLDRVDHVPSEKAEQLSRYSLEPQDLLFARSGATLGKVCLVPKQCNGWLMTGHLFRVRFDQSRVFCRFAFAALRGARSIRTQIFGQVRGATRPGYNTKLLGNVEIPLPSVSEQRRIVTELDALQAEVDTLRRLQAETAAALDALLPAVLDRAFKGEL